MKQLLKTYTTPTTLYVSGANITKVKEDEETCFHITDDYCSSGVMTNDTEWWIETDGSVVVMNYEQLVKAVNETEYLEDSENLGVVEVHDFVGTISVDLLDDDGNGTLTNDVNLEEDLEYQCRNGFNRWREPMIYLEGTFTKYERKELGDYSHLLVDKDNDE